MTTSTTRAGLPYRAVHGGRAVLNVLCGALLGALATPLLTMLTSLSLGLVPTVLGALVCFALLTVAVDALAALNRSRLAAFVDWHITPPRRVSRPGLLGWYAATLRSGAWWRAWCHGLLWGTAALAAGAVLVALFGGSVLLVTSFAHVTPPLAGLLPGVPAPVANSVGTLAGVVGLVSVAPLARLVTFADAHLAAALLGADPAAALEHRVEQLQESRSAAVEAADAERRRIERDLHDGAQQRLTSLAMNLGIARATLPDLPDPARHALEQAHTEAKAALTELRGIVRGLHPAVLDDRGLDAALSGLAGRMPMPVALAVDLPVRPPRQIEAVAYFVVSEALTNVVRHSGASQVEVSAGYVGPTLRIRVVDNGIGGADPGRGTGLTGLRQRIAAVEGTLSVHSPAGGPTSLEVLLPCVS